MSLKTKVTSLITTFILLCSLLTVGVFAVKNTTFNVGGDIVFNVQGIEATITRSATDGFTSNKTIGNEAGNILSDIELNNDMTADQVAAEFAPWSGLNLAFAEGATTATIKLTITNTADEGADNYLDITALASATTKNNAKVTVVNDAGGITALLEPQQSASFTITFSIIDDEYSASLEGFSVNFDMQKKVLVDFPVLSEDMTYETFKFTTNSDGKSVTVRDAGLDRDTDTYDYQSTGDIQIPSYVNIAGTVYPVTLIEHEAFGAWWNAGVCSSITSVDIPNTIIKIEYEAFAMTDLTSITIPASVTQIEQSIFVRSNIINIIVAEGNSVYDSRDNCNAIIETATDTLVASCNSSFIPDSVKEIGYQAFCESKSSSIIIPNGVTTIDSEALSCCSSLTSITIPESITEINAHAFEGNSFVSVTIDSQYVVDLLIDEFEDANCTYLISSDTTTINIRADLTPTEYLESLGTPTTVQIDGVTYKQYTKSV